MRILAEKNILYSTWPFKHQLRKMVKHTQATQATRFPIHIFFSTEKLVEILVNGEDWKSTHYILQVSNNHIFCDSESSQRYFCGGFLLGHQIYPFQFELYIWQDFGVNSSWLTLTRVASVFCTSYVLVTSVNYGSSNSNALQTFDLSKHCLKQRE